jgi:flagellar biosynthesis GTPase FlhF
VRPDDKEVDAGGSHVADADRRGSRAAVVLDVSAVFNQKVVRRQPLLSDSDHAAGFAGATCLGGLAESVGLADLVGFGQVRAAEGAAQGRAFGRALPQGPVAPAICWGDEDEEDEGFDFRDDDDEAFDEDEEEGEEDEEDDDEEEDEEEEDEEDEEDDELEDDELEEEEEEEEEEDEEEEEEFEEEEEDGFAEEDEDVEVPE